jgi:hypothetical protein
MSLQGRYLWQIVFAGYGYVKLPDVFTVWGDGKGQCCWRNDGAKGVMKLSILKRGVVLGNGTPLPRKRGNVILAEREKRTPKQQERQFKEWASLFSGKLFAMVVVYADETGTGGIPKSGEEPAPGIYGFLATPEEWDKFRLRWTKMLDEHGAKYFHFRELNPSFQKKHPDNPFSSWDEVRKDNFIYDMAFVAGSGPIPFGGNRPLKQYKTAAEAYEQAFDGFFADFSSQMDAHFPNEKDKVSFIFDNNHAENWIAILNKKWKEAIQRDSRIADEYTLMNPKTERGMPCQAADILAYVHRQNVSPTYDKGRAFPFRILDLAVGRKAFSMGGHPLKPLATMKDSDWYDLIQDMRKRKKQFDGARKGLGLEKKQYYPGTEHPRIREIYQKWILFNTVSRRDLRGQGAKRHI